MSHKLVALLCSSIKRYRIIYLVVSWVWHFFVATINRWRGCIHKVLYFMMTTSFKYVVKADKVALDISIGISNAVTYTCLGCEIYNHGNVIFSEDFLNSIFICNWSMNKSPVPPQSLNFFQTFILDVDIIVISNRINTDYFNALHIMEKTFYEVAADKASSTCHKNRLAF